MSLVFLFDQHDLAEIERQRPAALDGTVMACDLGIHLRLDQRGIRHLTPWDLVESDEHPALARFESQVQAFWSEHARIDCAGIDLLTMARFRHIACWARVTWAAYYTRRALTALTPDEVIALEELTGHGLDQPPGPARMPLLHALLRGMAEQYDVPVTVLSRENPGFTDRAAIASQCPPASDPIELPHRPYALFAGSGADLTRQIPVIAELMRPGDFDVVQLYRSADRTSLAALRGVGHLVAHESQVAPEPAPAAADRIAAATGRAAFDRARNDAPDELRGVFANRHLDIHFDFIFGEYAARMAAHVRRWETLLTRQPPRVVVAAYPAPVVEVAARMGIPCLLTPHGIMAQCDRRWHASLPACTIAAAGSTHYYNLLSAGIPDRRIRITGDVGCDHLSSGEYRNLAPRAGTRRRILVATNSIASPAQISALPEVDWKSAADRFAALGDLAARHGDWEFLIKPHPRYDQRDLYHAINRRLPVSHRLHIVENRPIAELATEADAIVFPNSRSSAIVEASFAGKSVYLLQPDMTWLDRRDWLLDAWPTVDSVEDLEAELQGIFADGTLHRQRAAQVESAARAFLGERPPVASQRCAELIQEIAARQPAEVVT